MKNPALAGAVKALDGGLERDRTVDLCNAIAALSQLSYEPFLQR